jgi:hypothetical protein
MENKMKHIALITTLLLFTGCAGLDSALSTRGIVSSNISKFDKTRSVSMTPSLTNHGGDNPEFGLYWEDKYNNKARLVVRMTRAVNFNTNKNLEVVVDGVSFSLSPVSKTDFGGIEYNSLMKQNKSEKDYIITKEQIKKIANGKEGGYRLHLLRTYIDGDINYSYQDYQTYIPKPFREFYKKVWGE